MRSDHGVQKDPEAIREVRRILREHVGVAQRRSGRSRRLEPRADAAPAVKLEMPSRRALRSPVLVTTRRNSRKVGQA